LAVILLIIGFIIAKIINFVVRTAFKRLGLDDLIEKSGLTAVLSRFGISGSIGELLAKLLFWFLMLGVIKIAVDMVGIKDLSLIIERVTAFLPKILIAAIILLVGFLVADIVQKATQKSLEAVGLDYAKTLAGLLFGFIAIIVLTVALSQLGIQTELLNAAVKIILMAVAIATGLSLGLGLKGHAGNIVSGVYARDLYQVGTEVEFEGELFKVSGVGPLTTKLQKADGSFMMVPNDCLISQEVKGRSAE